MVRGRPVLALAIVGALTASGASRAQEPPAPDKPAAQPVVVERVIARWRATELGSGAQARVVFSRELAFEARLEAMALGESPDATLTDRHVRAALARHVTEALLEELPLEPAASAVEVANRAVIAQRALVARVRGEERLEAARKREGITLDELDAMFRRTARASLYLDKMVAPTLEPSDLELRELHASGQTPFSEQRFADVVVDLRRWVLGQRMAQALDAFFQRTRSHLTITWAVKKPTATVNGATQKK
jgi:hypothetical protein